MPEHEQVIDFTGRVTDVVRLGQRGGTALLTHPDPRFVAVIHILSVSDATAPFKSGDEQAFAIHSPARLFGVSNPVGATFSFRLTGRTQDGVTQWQLALAPQP